MKTKIMKLLRVWGMGLLIFTLIIPPVYSDSAGKGKGADHGKGLGREEQSPGQGGQNRNNAGSENSNASSENRSSNASNAEIRRNSIERQRNQADMRANLPAAAQNKERNADHSKTRDRDLIKSEHKRNGINKKFEKARWSYNPKDERGQGNMGKVDMRDPYGFDKDSGREKDERGRAIHILNLNLAEIIGIDFTVGMLSYYQYLITIYQIYAQRYPQYAYFYNRVINYYTYLINNYTTIYKYDRLAVNLPYNTINYTMTFSESEKFEGTTLLVTTTLTSTNNYTSYTWVYNPTTRRWEWKAIYYDAGQTVMQQTQEVTLGENDTYSFTYDPPTELAGYTGFYGTLSVTVTEPESGATYTIDYDRQIYLYRCPYGRVYDVNTGKPIVGAKVTVLNEEGAIVSLDKASNSNARNPQTTDATGRYGFKLETNKKYYISVTAAGYKDFKTGVFTEKWHVLREDIALTPMGMMK